MDGIRSHPFLPFIKRRAVGWQWFGSFNFSELLEIKQKENFSCPQKAVKFCMKRCFVQTGNNCSKLSQISLLLSSYFGKKTKRNRIQWKRRGLGSISLFKNLISCPRIGNRTGCDCPCNLVSCKWGRKCCITNTKTPKSPPFLFKYPRNAFVCKGVIHPRAHPQDFPERLVIWFFFFPLANEKWSL